MTASLEFVRLKLRRRLRTLDSGFERQLLDPVAKRRIDKFAIQEGHISALWQAWCVFCRELLIYSVQGATTTSGTITTSPHTALDEMEIAFVAKQLSHRRPRPVNQIRPLTHNRNEHTWGDLGSMHRVVSRIGCSNMNSIRVALSVCSRVKDLQLCRNASAHINKSSLQDVRGSMVRYLDTKLRHPSDMMYWVDPDNNDFLWKSWIEELEIAAEFAIQ